MDRGLNAVRAQVRNPLCGFLNARSSFCEKIEHIQGFRVLQLTLAWSPK